MSLKASTALRNQMLGLAPMSQIFKDSVIAIYSGAAPATADLANTGTLLCTITKGSSTTPVAQVVNVTPVIGTSSAANWVVTVNGESVDFMDAGSPSVAQVCVGLTNALNVLSGHTAVTTPACTIQGANYGLFTATTDNTKVTITANTAGNSFSFSATNPSNGSGTLTAVLTTPNQYGLDFEPYADIAGGIISMNPGDVWSGVCSATGTAGYFRLQTIADTGATDGPSSFVFPRLQGTVSTANADMNMTSINKTQGATETISSASFTFPAQ